MKPTRENLVGGAAMFDKGYMQVRGVIMDDPASSYWLKNAICVLEARDPLDALMDAEVLVAIAKARVEACT